MGNLKLLHVGCANRYYEGFENSDKMTQWKGKKYRLDAVMPLGEPWPHQDDSIDGIVGMHVFQQLSWRELIVAFHEAYRVLKPGGVLRMGCPMIEMEDRSLDYLLGWNNINLFNRDLLREVLVYRIGFRSFKQCHYQETKVEEFKQIDNRKDRGTHYFEATK